MNPGFVFLRKILGLGYGGFIMHDLHVVYAWDDRVVSPASVHEISRSLKIPRGSESVNRRTANKMAKRKKEQTTIYKTYT